MKSNKKEYLLGINQAEFDRLQFQHEVWREVTENFFDRIGVKQGWNCLDVGAGPGFVSMDLLNRVGKEGSVTALEPAKYFLDWLQDVARNHSWSNLHFLNDTVETAELSEQKFDFIFIRWVIAFVDDQYGFTKKLVHALKPGGIIAFQDYYYEGLSLYPKGGAWDRMADHVRAYYRSGGGDPYVSGKLPAYLRSLGLKLIDYTPNARAGGPSSDIMEWAHRFFITHTQMMADQNIFSRDECDALLADWNAHRANPDAIFFAPIVVDVAGQREM